MAISQNIMLVGQVHSPPVFGTPPSGRPSPCPFGLLAWYISGENPGKIIPLFLLGSWHNLQCCKMQVFYKEQIHSPTPLFETWKMTFDRMDTMKQLGEGVREIAWVSLSVTRVYSAMSATLETSWAAACQAPCPWNFPGKNTGVCCHFLLQGIFLTRG